MLNKIFSLIVVILFISCTSHKNCSDFKTGDFRYVNPNFSDWEVSRNDTVQTETNKATGIVVSGTVRWKSDCEYEIVYTKNSHPKLQKMIGAKVEVKIISIDHDTITYQAKSDTIQMESKMVKVK